MGCKDEGGIRAGADTQLRWKKSFTKHWLHPSSQHRHMTFPLHSGSLGPLPSESQQIPIVLNKLKSISAGNQRCVPELFWWLTWKHAIAHEVCFLLWTPEGHTEIQYLCYCNYWDLKNRFITSSTGVVGGYGSCIFGFTGSWCSSLDQAELFLFLVHCSFAPICLAGSVWEEHLPLQHHSASADLQELYKKKWK